MRRPVVLGTVAGVLVALIAWFLVLYSPQSHHLSKLQAQESSLQATQSGLEAKLASLKKAQATQPQRQALLQQYQAGIPSTPDIAGFINEMNALAASSGVVLKTLTPGLPAITKGANYATIAGTVEVQGPYQGTLAFLTGLYSGSRLVVVDSVGVSASGSNLTSTLKLRLFTTAPPQTPAPTH